jgi:hypothetical protein
MQLLFYDCQLYPACLYEVLALLLRSNAQQSLLIVLNMQDAQLMRRSVQRLRKFQEFQEQAYDKLRNFINIDLYILKKTTWIAKL